MKAGNTFTIEPMVNAGGHNSERWPDNWTAVTSDGKPSAQFEQTLLVTDSGCDVLTARNTGRPWFMDQLEKCSESLTRFENHDFISSPIENTHSLLVFNDRL
ncbi:methionine aminopeptidase [Wuchereria bancrofti]|uniref:Methionine aminopeptidase n=1 Tax=Wuchereria bancrofti TaxID=6293 RepID=J9ATG0_WUCBA|nr:methionine aminopeptidase [Wuchereria bancrofti]